MQLQKIEIGYDPLFQWLVGLKFYSKDGTVVLQTEYDWVAKSYKTLTVHLEDGERVIGYKSSSKYPDRAWHDDFQLIIGRLI